MPLTDFEIIHSRSFDGELEICCMDGAQRVVAHVAREAWNDYFELPPGQTLRTAAEGNILAQSNMTALKGLIQKRYYAHQFEVLNRIGSTLPLITLKLGDLHHAPDRLSRRALDMQRQAHFQ